MSHKFRTNVEIISSAANTSGLRLNNLTATNTNTYTGVLVHDANGVVMSTSASNLAIVTVGPVAPTSPVVGQQWLDTSVSPSELNVWNGTSREPANNEVQHFANFASFPATGVEGVVYVDNATDNAYVRDTTTTSYVSVVGGASGIMSITDGTTTEVIGVGNTITFNENANIADVLDLTVSATDTVTLNAVAGATVGQTMVFNGTKFVFGNASAARYVNTYTPTVNVATTHTHSLAAGGDIIVQIYDTGTGELIHGEVIITSATTFDVIVTTADEIKVIGL